MIGCRKHEKQIDIHKHFPHCALQADKTILYKVAKEDLAYSGVHSQQVAAACVSCWWSTVLSASYCMGNL